MYLHPRIPKEQVIQQQVAEGVHAVVELDLRTQSLGRIPVQAFDRSAGMSNVRYDQYVDLDPNTAAEVILRAKTSGAANYSQSYGGAGGYTNAYNGPPQQQPQQATYQAQQPYPPTQAQASQSAAELAGLMGQVDNTTLQRLLTSIQATPTGGVSGVPATALRPGVAPPAAANQQLDIQAILGTLNGNAAGQQQGLPQSPYGTPYGAAHAMPNSGTPQTGPNGEAAAQVQNIMAQLARYRQ